MSDPEPHAYSGAPESVWEEDKEDWILVRVTKADGLVRYRKLNIRTKDVLRVEDPEAEKQVVAEMIAAGVPVYEDQPPPEWYA